MALDRIGLALVAKRLRGAAVLCLGYPDITAPAAEVERLLGVMPRKFTDHGGAHKVAHPLPETLDTLRLAGVEAIDCVDSMPSRGCERRVDLNERQAWPRRYGVVINPGTLEHCFDVAQAMFNAWRAVDLSGAILHAAPLSMMNHGFWNFSPTVIGDFAEANGGRVLALIARDGKWNTIPIDPVRRFVAPPESVLYALVEKVTEAPETIPVQWRYRK